MKRSKVFSNSNVLKIHRQTALSEKVTTITKEKRMNMKHSSCEKRLRLIV